MKNLFFAKNRFFSFLLFRFSSHQFVVHPKGYNGFVRCVLVHPSFIVVPSVVFKKNHRKQKDTTKASCSRRVFFVFFFFFFFKSKSIRRENDDVDDFVSHRDGWFCTNDDGLCDGDGW